MPMNLNPECELVSESDLRAALRPHQIAAADFDAGIRRRIQAAEAERANDPLANAPQLLRVAAAVLPLPIITGGKVAGSTLPLANASSISKLLGYVALPAISLFVMVGAFAFGAARIRSVQKNNMPDGMDLLAISEAVQLWWQRHKWAAWLIFAASLGLAMIGATSLMLLIYLISLGAMLYLFSGFARLGLANRTVIGKSVFLGMMFLGGASQMCSFNMQDIHFVDQNLLPVIFYCGLLVLIPVVSRGMTFPVPGTAGQRLGLRARAFVGCLFAVMLVSMMAWFTNPMWRPTTPARIKTHVEAFDEAPFSSTSWAQWEIVASWALESGLDPDLSGARRLLATEISGEQNPFVLGSAFRVGLARIEQIDQLSDGLMGYEAKRHRLLDDPHHIVVTQPISSLGLEDWVIRASVLRNDLTPAGRDLLEKRLHVNLEKMSTNPYRQIEEALRVTQLLEVIDRPIDRDRYRSQVHDLLRELHTTDCGLFQASGGFETYLAVKAGDLQATAYAVELMQIYGVPDDIDLNWVRSFLRPKALRYGDQVYIAAATLARLNHLSGVSFPTWLDYVYYERSLIMAALLVALCLYATMSSPVLRRDR